MKPRVSKEYQIRLSGLESKILTDVCIVWKIGCWISPEFAYVPKSQADFVIRALKMYQMEYATASKNRKRVKNIISQVEHAARNNIDIITRGSHGK